VKSFHTLSQELKESAKIPDTFPVILKMIGMLNNPPRHERLFFNAVQTLREILDGTRQANKKTLDDCKGIINMTLTDVWEKCIWQDIYLNRYHDGDLKGTANPNDLEVLHTSSTTYLAIERIYKKHASKEHDSVMWKAIIPFAREAAPFKQAIEEAKTKIVMGRIKTPEMIAKKEASINPNQVRGTCTWCNRNIAIITNQTMSHHGYQRPGWGYQTQSCSGMRYQCAEVSDVGYKEKLKFFKTQLIRLESEFDELKTATSFVVPVYRGKPKRIEKSVMSKYEWETQHKMAMTNADNSIRHIKSDIETVKKQIEAWSPITISVPKRKK
jgi:hypothetical protein